MKFALRELLVKLLLKVFGGVIRRIVSSADQGVMAAHMREGIGKLSDEYIDQAIRDIKKGDFRGYEDIISVFESGGITLDVMLGWLENEKALREHRRKYHPQSQ